MSPPIQADFFLFSLGILSGLGYGLDSLGDRIHSLFPPVLTVNNLGHVDIRVTPVVPHNLRPCAFAQHMAGMHGAEASKIASIARIGRVLVSAKSCLPTFAGKVIFGCVRATSATDLPMLW